MAIAVPPALRAALRRAASHVHRRAEWYWAPALYVAAVLWLYRAIAFPGEAGPRGFGWDTIESYWGDLAYLGRQLAGGEWPLWNPYDRGGFPAHADPQAGVFYPVNWLLAAIGAAMGETPWWLIQLKVLLHHVIGGAMMHVYLRSRRLPAAAAATGGIACIASTPMLIHKASNLLWPLMWTPLVWLAIDAITARPSWRRAAALAAALMLPATAGSPPGFFYTLLLCLGYGALRAGQRLHSAWRQGRRRELLRTARRLAVALGLAAALSAALLLVVFVYGLAFAEHSPRAERTLAYAVSRPLPIDAALLGMIAPMRGMIDAYVGVVALALAMCALAVAPARDRGAPIFFVGAAVFGLLLSFGAATPVLPWLVEHAPGFGLFRVAKRYTLLTGICLAACAAYGVAALADARRTWSRERVTALGTAGLVLAAVAIALAASAAPPRPGPVPGWRAVAFAIIGAALIASMLLHQRRGVRFVIALIPLVVLYEVPSIAHPDGRWATEKRPDEADRERLAGLEDVATRWRIYDEFVLEQRVGSRLGVRDLRGYPAGDPLSLVRYNELLLHARRHPEILEAYNVRYVFWGPHHRARTRAHFLKVPPDRKAPSHFVRLRPDLIRARHPAPLAAWYGAVRVVPRRAALDAVRAAEQPDGTRRVAILEPEQAAALGDLRAPLERAAVAPPPSMTGELVRYGANRIRVRIVAPGPGLVVLNEVAYPGWQVHVDGRRATPITANHLLRAVAVEAGAHVIEWRYRPPRLGLLIGLWWLAMGVLAAALFWPRRRDDQAEPVGGETPGE